MADSSRRRADALGLGQTDGLLVYGIAPDLEAHGIDTRDTAVNILRCLASNSCFSLFAGSLLAMLVFSPLARQAGRTEGMRAINEDRPATRSLLNTLNRAEQLHMERMNAITR